MSQTIDTFRAGTYYFGRLNDLVEQPSKEIICGITKQSQRNLDRQIQKIVDAGVPPTLTVTDEPLPPLVIDREEVMRKSAESVENLGVIPVGYILDCRQQLPMDEVDNECVGK